MFQVLEGAIRVMVRRATASSSAAMGCAGGRVEHQAAVDLVGADDEVVALGELGDAGELVAVEHAADRVVRVAQHEQPRAVGEGGLGGGPVPAPAPAVMDEGRGEQALPEVGRRVQEGRVHRGGGEHAVAGLADRPHRHVEAGDHARQPHQPVGLDVPAVVAGDAGLHGLDSDGHGSA
jgi:hypothetical protein